MFIVEAQTTWANCQVNGVPTLKCLEIIYSNIIGIAAGFMLMVLFIMFLVGGFYYLTSFGEQEKLQKGQKTLKFAIIGFVLYVSSFLILAIIDFLFLDGTGNSLLKFQIGTTP